MKRAHRHREGTDAHVTADRSDRAPRRTRNTVPMSEGGARACLAPCKDCGAQVIYHKLSGDRPILLDPAELKHGDEGARYIIMFGFVCPDPQPGIVDHLQLPMYRKHECPPS
jgi:hypothetical protein